MAQTAAPVIAVRLVMTDVQGTPVMKKDLQGHILARYDYRPYGAQQAAGVEAGPGYTGHVTIPQTGLVYMQQRYYDPAVGRFLSVDPVGPSPGNIFYLNRYGYVNSNPVNRVDPAGMYNCDTKNNKDSCEMVRKARERTQQARNRYVSRSPQAKALQRILDAFGTENDENNVSIAFGVIDNKGSHAQPSYNENAGILVKFIL
ncbi:RHS repeat-associated core domain-containing protein [Rhodanobacter lindaniclasticus]